MPLTYHAGQIEVQTEANTRRVADKLSSWVGPVGEFTLGADLILLASVQEDGLRFAGLSGEAPLVAVEEPGRVLFSQRMFPGKAAELLVGGIAINLSTRRRARLNGRLTPEDDGSRLEAAEAFCNCRKYIAPTFALEQVPHLGPVSSEELAFDDAWLAEVVARAETSFLASVSPAGQPDVSHRGGPAGFLSLDPRAGELRWPEFVGDGMFKSAGNVRASEAVSLLVLDLESGDAAQLDGRGEYRTVLRYKEPRTEGLMTNPEPYPVQGEMTVRLSCARRLRGLTSPRKHVEGQRRITSCDSAARQSGMRGE